MRSIQAPSTNFKGKIKEYSQMNLIDDKNEIVVPMTEGELSEDFREFIERDPSFTPEIYSQNLLNVLLQQDSLTTTD
jgi:hypothetical protein